jgi:hypothetical protein
MMMLGVSRMSDLHQRIFVNCPPHAARDYIARYFEDKRAAGHAGPHDPIRLALRAPVTLPALQTEIVLQRDVVATVAPQADARGDLARMTVDWEPAGGGPFPRFHGSLVASNDEGYESFSLVLDGAYEPPMGASGAAFDAALGHRIAIATARNLLAEVRDGIEKAYAATEYSKQLKREDELQSRGQQS